MDSRAPSSSDRLIAPLSTTGKVFSMKTTVLPEHVIAVVRRKPKQENMKRAGYEFMVVNVALDSWREPFS